MGDGSSCRSQTAALPFTQTASGRRGALRDLVEAVCEGLRQPHADGWVHRDIKPANILLLEGRWVVGDWGLSRRPLGQSSGLRRTRTGTGFGTEGFAAPEMSGDAHDSTPATDIYSIGQLIGAVLTGRRPQANIPLLPESRPMAGRRSGGYPTRSGRQTAGPG